MRLEVDTGGTSARTPEEGGRGQTREAAGLTWPGSQATGLTYPGSPRGGLTWRDTLSYNVNTDITLKISLLDFLLYKKYNYFELVT